MVVPRNILYTLLLNVASSHLQPEMQNCRERMKDLGRGLELRSHLEGEQG